MKLLFLTVHAGQLLPLVAAPLPLLFGRLDNALRRHRRHVEGAQAQRERHGEEARLCDVTARESHGQASRRVQKKVPPLPQQLHTGICFVIR